MSYRQDVFATQYILTEDFVRNLMYYRAIRNRMLEFELKSAFWAACADSNLLQASIKWCGVFGSNGCNQAHWHNLVHGDVAKLKKSFREGLFKIPGLSSVRWKDYWEEMTSFRNDFAAHRALKVVMPVPSFDLALDVAYYYDQWVRSIIQPDLLSARPLRQLAKSVGEEARLELEKAITGP